MKAFPIELRQRVMDDYEDNKNREKKHKLTIEKLAVKWKVSADWIKKIRKQFKKTGSLEPITPKTGPKPKLEPHRELLNKIVTKKPDATLEEIQKLLPINVSLPTIASELIKLKLIYKKAIERCRARSSRCRSKTSVTLEFA
ncbi:MAG: hypothetical protein ACRC2T_20070 [Thermoguttaceae bacterium]